jgi:hypothetical protein
MRLWQSSGQTAPYGEVSLARFTILIKRPNVIPAHRLWFAHALPTINSTLWVFHHVNQILWFSSSYFARISPSPQWTCRWLTMALDTHALPCSWGTTQAPYSIDDSFEKYWEANVATKSRYLFGEDHIIKRTMVDYYIASSTGSAFDLVRSQGVKFKYG